MAEPHDCDHCGEADASVDLGYLQYCQRCFDAAVDGFAVAYGMKERSDEPR